MNDDQLLRRCPWVVLLWGAPAAGKTTLARHLIGHFNQLAPPLVVPHLSSDSISRALVGGHFMHSLRPAIYEGLLTMAAQILVRQQGLLLDGTFLDPAFREQVRQLATSCASPVVSVLVHCPLQARLERNRLRPDSERVPEAWVRNAHLKAYIGREDADVLVDSQSGGASEAVPAIVAQLERKLRLVHGLVRRQSYQVNSRTGCLPVG